MSNMAVTLNKKTIICLIFILLSIIIMADGIEAYNGEFDENNIESDPTSFLDSEGHFSVDSYIIELRKSNRNASINMLSWFHETTWNPERA